jgi:hypothetical protein
MDAEVDLPQSIFCVQVSVFDRTMVNFVPLRHIDLVTDDTIETTRQVIATALSVVDIGRLAIFIASQQPEIAYEVCGCMGREVNLAEVLAALSPARMMHADDHRLESVQDIIEYERSHVLCELPHFSRTRHLLVVLYSDSYSSSMRFWPFLTNYMTNSFADYSNARSCKRDALQLRGTPKVLGSITEAMEVQRCVVDFRLRSDCGKIKSMIPEYVFRKLNLGPNVPFAMRRSLCSTDECSVMVHVPSLDFCKRNWPFWTLRCNRSIRPAGIVFRVFYDETRKENALQIEWLPNGNFRATVEQYVIAYDNIAEHMEQNIMDICHRGFATLLLQLQRFGLPAVTMFDSIISEVQFNYFIFASIPDIRRLVDDRIREYLFSVPDGHENRILVGDMEDEDVGDDDQQDKKTSYGGGGFGGVKCVALVYEPIMMRDNVGGLSSSRLALCKIFKSASNGVVCRVRLKNLGCSFLFALHAVVTMRYMIVNTIPREYDKPHSKLGLERIDPELYHSVKNSGLSRKVWTFYEKSTDCKRCRRAVPLNPNNERDMERYRSAKEAGPLLWYRNNYYGSPDDENMNGEKIRALREKSLSETNGRKKKKKMNADLNFFGLPILKSIDEQKYRTQGYEGEEFRFAPASIRYYHGMKIPQRHLASMAPLYRKGIVAYVGQDAENVNKQLKEFSEKADVGVKYVIKANKTLGPGEYGEMPPGTLREFVAKISPHKKILRRGVPHFENNRYASLHALLSNDDVGEECCDMDISSSDDDANNGVDAGSAAVKNEYVKKQAEKMVKECPKWMSAGRKLTSELYCELFSVWRDINVVIFHFSYTRPHDIAVTFVGGRYDVSNKTIMLIQSGAIYEPMCADGDLFIDEQISYELSKLYQVFCPQDFQLYERLKHLGGRNNIESQVVNNKNQLVGVILKNLPEFIVPMVMRQHPLNDLPVILMHQQLAYPSIDFLLNHLRRINMSEYVPKYAITDVKCEYVFAVVLADTRIVCPLKDPVCVKNMPLEFRSDTYYMGVPTGPLKPDIALALGKNTAIVKDVFLRILMCIHGWVQKNPLWNSLMFVDCRTRRREIQKKFIEPAVEFYDDIIPIQKHIMIAMLVAWCDHRPDPDTWPLHNDVFEPKLASLNPDLPINADLYGYFKTPTDYLVFIARRNT